MLEETTNHNIVPQVIVLTAGQATRLWPLTLGFPKALLSVGGKPAILHMLLPLIQRGLRNITLVINPGTQSVVDAVLGRCLAGAGVDLHYVEQHEPMGPGHALSLCADLISSPTLLLLGDTLCEPPSTFDYDWIGVSPVEPETVSRWCMVQCQSNGTVFRLIDKPATCPGTNLAAIGTYFFRDPDALRSVLHEEARSYKPIHGEFQLSSVLTAYMKQRRLHSLKVSSWVDLGTLENYASGVRSALPRRHFNNISVSPIGELHKRSSSPMSAEIGWYRELSQDPASILSPRFIGEDPDAFGYTTEYLDYPTLAEVLLYGCATEETWRFIFGNLIANVCTRLWQDNQHPTDITTRARSMYEMKTIERLDLWGRQDLLEREGYVVNGERVRGFATLWQMSAPLREALIQSSSEYSARIHGDMSFGNILISPRSCVIRLVDPRGDFGRKDLLGDRRYDAAKLRQCYHGRYDAITHDLFSIREVTTGSFVFRQFFTSYPEFSVFDEQLTVAGFKVADLQLLESLLFFSMIPLHPDSPDRQLAFFIIALQCLESLVS